MYKFLLYLLTAKRPWVIWKYTIRLADCCCCCGCAKTWFRGN